MYSYSPTDYRLFVNSLLCFNKTNIHILIAWNMIRGSDLLQMFFTVCTVLLTGVQLGVILIMIVHTINITLDCDCYTSSSELVKGLNWQTFPERVTY